MPRRLALLLSLSLFPAAFAQAPPRERAGDRAQIRQDRREVAQDQRQIADDRRDAQRFTALLQAYDAARTGGQPAPIAEVERRVQNQLAVEVAESNRELAQKNREAARSGAEVRGSRREVRRDVVRGQPGRAVDDRRDLRDDRRDAQDDRRDANREAAQGARIRAIQQEFTGLVGRMDPPSLDRKRALIAEAAGLQRAEVAGGRQELREDRRELREDKRELREDRRR